MEFRERAFSVSNGQQEMFCYWMHTWFKDLYPILGSCFHCTSAPVLLPAVPLVSRWWRQRRTQKCSVFFILVSRYSAVSVSQQHIYCQLPTQSRTCKNMQSLFLLSVIIWFADAELKPRKGKSRPRWCVYVSRAKYDAWKWDSLDVFIFIIV